MDYEKKYKEALERARKLKENPQGVFYEYSPDEGDTICDYIFPELADESEDEKIRKEIVSAINIYCSEYLRGTKVRNDMLTWVEKQCKLVNSLSKGLDNAHERIDELIRKNNELCIKLESQGEIDKISYEIAEKEKREFVGDGFIECHADFLDFKEGNTYWLEYIGDDEYNVRSDNLLGKTYHITPCQLYTVFKKQTWLEKQGGQIGSDVKDYNSIDPHFAKPIDNVKPKFKVGDWIVNNISKDVFLIKSVNSGYCTLEDTKGNIYSPCLPFESDFHLWTIDDARDGDVLSYVTDEEDLWIMIYWSLYEPYEGHVHYHALLVNDNFSDKGTCCICINDLKPATKEQRELLFAKMKESGHKWNDKKKELEKIEQKQDAITQINPSDYVNDMGGNGCYLKNTTQVSAWTEDDKKHMASILTTLLMEAKNAKIEQYRSSVESDIDWIYSLKNKDRVQPKQKWSEEDEKMVNDIIAAIDTLYYHGMVNWLKSLKERYTWKPSDEQIRALHDMNLTGNISYAGQGQVLVELYNDLKKLTE